MRLLVAALLAPAALQVVTVPDIGGTPRSPLKSGAGETAAVFFVSKDCPISNFYSQEIRRICEEYSGKGLRCSLVYIEPTLSDAEAGKHAQEYGHGSYPKIVDRNHAVVDAAKATVTPEVVLVRPDESVAYRGRIDNFYVALGKKRRVVTERDLRDALEDLAAGRKVAKPETTPVGCYIPPLSAYR